MGLVPEFFMLLGIYIFLAMSLLSALLERDTPPRSQWLFQGAAALGLGELFLSQGINGGVFDGSPTDAMPFWVSMVYLALALSSVVGMNVYLAAVRRRMALTSTFSGMVTVPICMISGLSVSSFLGGGGEVGFTPVMAVLLVISALVISLSLFGFLREASKHLIKAPGGLGSSPTGPVPTPPGPAGVLPLHLHSMRGEEWEESPAKDEGEE